MNVSIIARLGNQLRTVVEELLRVGRVRDAKLTPSRHHVSKTVRALRLPLAR